MNPTFHRAAHKGEQKCRLLDEMLGSFDQGLKENSRMHYASAKTFDVSIFLTKT